MQGISLNYHGGQKIPLGTEWLQQIYNFVLYILVYHAHLHHIILFFNFIFLLVIHTFFYLQEKDKMLRISSQKTKAWEIMLTVKSQPKKNQKYLITTRSNQSYKMHNYFLSRDAWYIIFIIIFHLLTLVQYLISMFHLNCLLVQSIISCHQC